MGKGLINMFPFRQLYDLMQWLGYLRDDFVILREGRSRLISRIETINHLGKRRKTGFSLDEKKALKRYEASLSLISAVIADSGIQDSRSSIPEIVKDVVRNRDGNVCVRCREEEGRRFVRLSGDSSVPSNVSIYCTNCADDRFRQAVISAGMIRW